MSRQKYSSRGRVTQRMSRDGLIERNEATGEEKRVSKREAGYELRGGETPEPGVSPGYAGSSLNAKGGGRGAPDEKRGAANQARNPRGTRDTRDTRRGARRANYKRRKNPLDTRLSRDEKPEAPPAPDAGHTAGNPPETRRHPTPASAGVDTGAAGARPRGSPPLVHTSQESSGGRRITPNEAEETRPKPSRLKFSLYESQRNAPPGAERPGGAGRQGGQPKQSLKLARLESRLERAGEKLEKAKGKLPSKRRIALRYEPAAGEQTEAAGAAGARWRLRFEKTPKTQKQHLKGPLLLRPVKAAASGALRFAHGQVRQAEDENVAVKAAHRAEELAEGGARSALRHHKSAPYRKAAKLEEKMRKQAIRLNYEKIAANNPQLKSSLFSRMAQKQKIKREYAKAARETAKTAKKAVSSSAKAAKLVAAAARKIPLLGPLLLIALLMMMILIAFSMCATIGSAMLTFMASSYLAGDGDIEKAELSYMEWETDLRIEALDVESAYPGFDEYVYDTGPIGHNPYEMMAYLTAVYQDFSYDGVPPAKHGIRNNLKALFAEQYSSYSYTPATETRYADPTDADGDGDYEPYEWAVLRVTLETRPFGEVILAKMNDEQKQHYELLMQTKGNRQYAGNPFAPTDWLPHISGYYGYRVSPISGGKEYHKGIDIAFPAGTEIRAAQTGRVTFAGNGGDYGNLIVIENDEGLTTKYGHCDTLLVNAGQGIEMGDVIATVGNTGASTGPHLHLEVIKDGKQLNSAYFADTGSFSFK